MHGVVVGRLQPKGAVQARHDALHPLARADDELWLGGIRICGGFGEPADCEGRCVGDIISMWLLTVGGRVKWAEGRGCTFGLAVFAEEGRIADEAVAGSFEGTF